MIMLRCEEDGPLGVARQSSCSIAGLRSRRLPMQAAPRAVAVGGRADRDQLHARADPPDAASFRAASSPRAFAACDARNGCCLCIRRA